MDASISGDGSPLLLLLSDITYQANVWWRKTRETQFHLFTFLDSPCFQSLFFLGSQKTCSPCFSYLSVLHLPSVVICFFYTITHCGYQCAFLAFIHHTKIHLFAVSSAQANIIKRPNKSLAASELLEPVVTPSKTQSEVGGRGD